jgi:ferrous iron transport protein A
MTLDLLPLGREARIVAVDWAGLAPEEAARLRALGI